MIKMICEKKSADAGPDFLPLIWYTVQAKSLQLKKNNQLKTEGVT